MATFCWNSATFSQSFLATQISVNRSVLHPSARLAKLENFLKISRNYYVLFSLIKSSPNISSFEVLTRKGCLQSVWMGPTLFSGLAQVSSVKNTWKNSRPKYPDIVLTNSSPTFESFAKMEELRLTNSLSSETRSGFLILSKVTATIRVASFAPIFLPTRCQRFWSYCTVGQLFFMMRRREGPIRKLSMLSITLDSRYKAYYTLHA